MVGDGRLAEHGIPFARSRPGHAEGVQSPRRVQQ